MNKIFLLITLLFSSTFSISSFTYPWIVNLTGDTATVVKLKSNNDTVKAFCDRAADTITNNSARIDTLEDTIAVHSLKIDSLQDTSSLQSARIDTLEDTVAVHSTHLDAVDDSIDNRYTKSASDDRYVNEDGDTLVGKISISNGNMALELGAVNASTARTDNTSKASRISSVQYDNEEEGACITQTFDTDVASILNIGGGTSQLNARTEVNIYTASAINTLTGTLTARIVPDTLAVTGTGAFTVAATAPIIGDTVVDYAATSTVTGWSSFTSKVIRYQKCGKVITVWFELRGTSNTNAAGFTLPVPHFSGLFTDFNFTAVDNGSPAIVSSGFVDGTLGSRDNVTLQPTPSSITWTASGTKYAYGQFTYFID